MASETSTPNIGLQVPAYNQANWQVPTNYNWNLLDLIFGGQVTVPALSVETFAITNIGAQIAASFIAETPSGVVPGNVYVMSQTPTWMIAFFWNGVFQRPVIDYTLSAATITMTTAATSSGDTVFALYLYNAA
jgi:hypothetical protein